MADHTAQPGSDEADLARFGYKQELKRELGTGVLVVCGQNSARGGIFDYWGVPLGLRRDVARILDRLRDVRYPTSSAGSKGGSSP